MIAILMLFTVVSCSDAGEEATTQATTSNTTVTTATSATTTQNQSNTQPEEPEYLFPEEIKNLIIIIGDGMGPQHIKAGQLYENTTYEFTSWKSSLCNTNSIKANGTEVLTDSAASATALATGTLTLNSYLGKDKDGNNLKTILDIAIRNKKSVGVVTTDYLYGATPAGFSGHSTDRNESDYITETEIASDVNFLCGLRSDSHYEKHQDLLETFEVHYATDLNDKETIFNSEYVMLPIDIENGASNAVELKDATAFAIEYLERDTDGFVLMVEQAYIDKYSHNNNMSGMLDRMASLNDTVETVMDWIGERTDTAVIVTADHETGGLYVSSDAKYDNSVSGAGKLYYQWTSVDHTQTMVNIYVYGVDVDYAKISRYNTAVQIKNADVFTLMKAILRFK